MTWLTLFCWLLTACSSEPRVAPTVEGRPTFTTVTGTAIERIDLLSTDGLVLETRRLNPAVDSVQLSVGWSDGARNVRVHTSEGTQDIAIPEPLSTGPVEVLIDAPIGQGSAIATHQSIHHFSLVDGAHAQVGVVVHALEAGDFEVQIGDAITPFPATKAGAKLSVMATIGGRTDIAVRGPTPADILESTVDVNPVTLDSLRDQLRLVDAPFPVDNKGEVEIDRPQDRVTLPAPWWQELLKFTSLGTRNWGRYQPWGNQGVRLQNNGDRAINVAIRTVITRTDGTPDPIFRPQFRDIDSSTDETSALLRVPAHSTATAVLPVYIDDTKLGTDLPPDGWRRRIEVTPLGVDTPIVVAEPPLYVSRASTLSSVALLVGILGALVGLGMIARRWRTWLSVRTTTSLMVIAMFGAMMFTVSAGGQLFGMGIAALLGPFSSLLTGLVDDAFRTALMMTLLALHPKPGTAALAILVQSLIGALTLGHIGPAQLLIIGNSVLWTELFLWLTGVTRPTDWARGPAFWMWARVASALAFANLMTGGLGLVLAAVLYRFYYADWYVIMILAGPSFAYVFIGCAIALPFARSLREVSP